MKGWHALAALALAACSETPRAAPPQPRAAHAAEETILLAVDGASGEGYFVDPIALVTPGGLRNPWDVAEDSVFIARWYTPRRRYPMRIRGIPAGEAVVFRALDAGCTDRLAQVEIVPPQPLPDSLTALAWDGFRAPPIRPPLRAPAAGELRVLAALADSIHAARGVSAELRARVTREAVFALDSAGAQGPVLVGSFNISTQAGAFERVIALMLVAEREGQAYRPAYVFYADLIEDEMVRLALMDAADLDGDRMPELVARATYYESWDYAILRRGPGGWTKIYHGGGGGC